MIAQTKFKLDVTEISLSVALVRTLLLSVMIFRIVLSAAPYTTFGSFRFGDLSIYNVFFQFKYEIWYVKHENDKYLLEKLFIGCQICLYPSIFFQSNAGSYGG